MTNKKLEEIAEHANNTLCKLESQLERHMEFKEGRDIDLNTIYSIYLVSDYIGMGLLPGERLKVFKEKLGKVIEYQVNMLRASEAGGSITTIKICDYENQVLKGLNGVLNLYFMSKEESGDSESSQ